MPGKIVRILTTEGANVDVHQGIVVMEAMKMQNEIRSDRSGRVVKLISALLKHLPPAYNYKVIFMRRAMPEILASQRQMLIRRGEPADTVPDDKMAAMFNKHVAQVESWLAAQPNIDVLYVSYNEVMKDSRPQAERINLFLGGSLKVEEMVDVVDSGLYRQQHESS